MTLVTPSENKVKKYIYSTTTELVVLLISISLAHSPLNSAEFSTVKLGVTFLGT